MLQSNYIYVIRHDSAYICENKYELIQTQKIGSTQYPKARFATYITYTPIRPTIYKLYFIDYNCYEVDDMIKINFDKFNVKLNGGTEFYTYDLTVELLEIFFAKNQIKFTIIDPNTLKYENYVPTINEITQFVQEINFQKAKELKLIKIIKKPKDYQEDIISKAYEYYITQDNTIGKIIMTCGTGKSLVAYWICSALNVKKVLVLVPSLYLLNQIGSNFIEQANDECKKYNFAFIGSDLDIAGYQIYSKNDTKDVKNFMQNEHYIVFSTYQSCMVLSEYDFDLIIFDEAHRTATQSSKEDYTGFNYYVQNKKNTKKLFMTATEKICNNTENEDEIQIISMDNEKIYGKTICHLNINQAIKLEALCDYNIIIHNENMGDILTENDKEEVQKNYFNCRNINRICMYYAKARIIEKFIKKYNVKKIITKHSTCENAFIFKNILNSMMPNIYIDYIDGDCNIKNRKKIIDKFIKSEVAIICQAKILSEGVNIIECDCVCPIDDIESTIDIIQFIGRMLRLCEGKKRAYILLPMLTAKNTDIINDKKEYNNVRIILRAISYEDERIKNYFSSFKLNNNVNKTKENNIIHFDGNVEIDKYNNIELEIVKHYNKLAPMEFEKARDIIRNKKFIGMKDYNKWCEERTEHTDIPRNPDKIYKNFGWIGWLDWLGKYLIDKKEIINAVARENERRKIIYKELTLEEKIYYNLADGKKMTIEELEKIIGCIVSPNINNLKQIDKKDNYYFMSIPNLKYCQIDTDIIYDDWAKNNNIPLYYELKELYDINSNILFGINNTDYLDWDECLKICKNYYKENKSNNFYDLYEQVKKIYPLPNDPATFYESFENYEFLFID